MKYLTCLLLAITVLTVSTTYAGEIIGPAYRQDGGGSCGVGNTGYDYEGDNTVRIQFSNGKTGHATWKCKLNLVDGDPQVSTSEFTSGSFLISGDVCQHTVQLEGETAMWTAQCFYVWFSGD
jgi:hypothetical protein